LSAEDTPTTVEGTRVGNYLLGKRLAAGGMAELFSAEPVEGRHFDTPIVVKRMLPKLASDPAFVAMFINEARISARLDHGSIVRVYDFEATEHGLCLVMELIDGPDLLAVLKRLAKQRAAMPEELAVYVAYHTLEALDYAHSASAEGRGLNIIHRDVSPSNILLSRRGHVKLADFGIARAAEGQKENLEGNLKGKYGYMSPEQIEGKPLDPRSDVFSMGIVLAEMLTGRRLFTAPGNLELLLMVRRADLKRLDEYHDYIPVELDAIVRKALARDRAQRFASAAEFRDALADWLSNSNKRAGADKLTRFIRALEERGGDLVKWSRPGRSDASTTMSGTDTRMTRLQVDEAAQIGLELFSAEPTPTAEVPSDGLTLQPFDAISLREQTPPPEALTALVDEIPEDGSLDRIQLVDVLCQIGSYQRSGLLEVKRGPRVKQAYFADGQPEFVRSNVPEDRFGQFLVRKGHITEKQLTKVLSLLPHFGGRIGQTLVGLGLLEPVDAVRLLADQVEYKLVHACSWRSGSYTFRDGVANPWPALTLELNTLTIAGHSVHTIRRPVLEAWEHRAGTSQPAVDLAGAEQFGFDAELRNALEALSGERELSAVATAVAAWVGRERFLGTTYLLWRCGLLAGC
jgi:serine/threonine protein kinase